MRQAKGVREGRDEQRKVRVDERWSYVARLLGELTQPLLDTHARLPFE